jgi:hypothetical protein
MQVLPGDIARACGALIPRANRSAARTDPARRGRRPAALDHDADRADRPGRRHCARPICSPLRTVLVTVQIGAERQRICVTVGGASPDAGFGSWNGRVREVQA